MIGMLYMERLYTRTQEELEEAIRIGELDPLVVNLPPVFTERDTVFVYYEWFDDIGGWSGTDWSHVQLGLIDFMKQFPASAA